MDVNQHQYQSPAGWGGGGVGNGMARTAIIIGNTTEETVDVDEINPVPVEKTEPAENTEK